MRTARHRERDLVPRLVGLDEIGQGMIRVDLCVVDGRNDIANLQASFFGRAVRKLRARMTLQVHDELVLECPENEIHIVAPLICDIMENAYPLDPKLKVDVSAGQNWDEMLAVETR